MSATETSFGTEYDTTNDADKRDFDGQFEVSSDDTFDADYLGSYGCTTTAGSC